MAHAMPPAETGFAPYFETRSFRLNRKGMALAIVLSALQFALLLLIAYMRETPQASPDALAVIEVPDSIAAPTPQSRPEPRDRKSPGGGRNPDIAPAAPAAPRERAVPQAPIRLTRHEVPAAPVAPVMIADRLDIGLPDATGTARGTGTGTGSGTGQGAGTGTGSGRGSAREAAGQPQRQLTTRWAPTMRFDWLHLFYPREARLEQIAGVAQLECEVIGRDRVRDCRVLAEAPAGYGFGDAALEAQRIYRVRVTDEKNRRVYNERAVINAHFRPEER